MLSDIYRNDAFENILKYCNILTGNSIKIPHKKYFINQRKYEKVPVIGENVSSMLYILSRIKQPESILEIGFGSGFSAISILSGIDKKIVNNKNFSFISLEREKKRFNRGIKLINYFEYNIDLKKIDFFEYINEIKEKKLMFDFVFVDSVKKRYIEIFRLLEDHINKNGIIVFDNILFNGRVVSLKSQQVKKYLNGSKMLNKFNIYASLNKKFEFLFLTIDDGIAIGIKK